MTPLSREPIPHIGDGPLGDAALILGRRGSGKSYFQRLAFERALTKGIRTGWIDALGIAWGVTVAGKPGNLKKPVGAGYDVVIFGGDHGHIPITEQSGTALGRQLAKARFSWVIDISRLPSKAARVRFMLAFCEALYEHVETRLLLLIDETDLWAPQQLGLKGGPEAHLLGAMDEIVRRGRVKGLVPWMASQRSAEVAMKIRSQADVLICFKLTAPHDIEAATDWIKYHVGKAAAEEWKGVFPSLAPGEAMVYLTTPELKVFRHQFPLIETLDTMSPNAGGRAVSYRGAARPDLDAIRSQLGTIETELKANDPAELKKRISELERELKKKPAAAPVKVDIKAIEDRAYKQGYNVAGHLGMKEVDRYRRAMSALHATLQKAIGQIPMASEAGAKEIDTKQAPRAVVLPPKTVVRDTAPVQPHPIVKVVDGDLPGQQQRIIDALAWWIRANIHNPTREMVAFRAGFKSASGGYFSGEVRKLKGAGLIDYPENGRLSLTDAGGERAANIELEPTSDELIKEVRSILPGQQQRIFDVVVVDEGSGGPISREDVARIAKFESHTGGYFSGEVRKMKSAGIITYPADGMLAAARWLYLENGNV